MVLRSKVDVEQRKKLPAKAGFARGTRLTHTVGRVANPVPAARVSQAQLTRIGIDLQIEAPLAPRSSAGAHAHRREGFHAA